MDGNGNLAWAKTYAQQALMYGLAANQDGGFFVVGADFAYGPPTPGLILRCDSGGAILWDKLYVNALNWAGAFSTRDGGLLILDYYSRLTKIDAASGAILWDWGYYRPSEPVGISYATRAAAELLDGGAVLLMDGGAGGTLLLKVDQDGGIVWCRRYPELSLRQSGYQWLQPTPGGYLISASLKADNSAPVLVWLDDQGVVFRTKVIRGGGDIDGWTMGINGGTMFPGGSVVAVGGAGDPRSQGVCSVKYLLKVDSEGEVLWSRGWSYPTPLDGGVYGLFPMSGGFVIAGWGDDFGESFVSQSLLRFDGDGHGMGACRTEKSDIISVAGAEVTSLPVLDMERSTYPYVYPVDVHHVLTSMSDIPDHLLCGTKYPGIASIKKLQNPFRLRLTGRNFEQGSVVLINGIEVPRSSFVGTGKWGISTIVAKGTNLKNMLPKGAAACITVKNLDGKMSDCVNYAR